MITPAKSKSAVAEQTAEQTVVQTTAGGLLALLTSAEPILSAAPGGVPFVRLPPGYTALEVENLLPSPTRKRGTVSLNDVRSFCSYINDEKTSATRIYGTMDPPSFCAIFNDHHEAGAGWRDYRAVYACPKSKEWDTWIKSNRQAMSQESFAEFVENNAQDCVSPAAAAMIELSLTLNARKSVNFASAIRLDNGQREFTYEETVTGSAGAKGKMQIPEAFALGIPALEGGPRYELRARLRYRISDKGVLSLWYDLERPHKVMEDAAKDVVTRVETDTGLSVFMGIVA